MAWSILRARLYLNDFSEHSIYIGILIILFTIYDYARKICDENAGKVFKLIIVLAFISVIASNTFSLIGALIALFGLLLKYPELGEKSFEKETKIEVDPKEVYEKLLEKYREADGKFAERSLEKDLKKIQNERKVSRDEAILILYKEFFLR